MLEKLTLNNMNIFKEVYLKSINNNSYNKDFFRCYDSQNFLLKFLYRKSIRLIKVNGKYIGYLWVDDPDESYIKVWALFIDKKYTNLINENTLAYFNGCIISYEEIDSLINTMLLSKLGFRKINYTLLLKLDLNTYINKDIKYSVLNKFKDTLKEKTKNSITLDFNIKKLIIGKDEVLRCNMQNDIFSQVNRNPLTLDDIYADISQDYFIGDLCFFGTIDNEYVGYGQIIFNRNMYTIVNFGILTKYRGLGLSKLLLNDIIIAAKKYGIKELFIRVDSDNIKAINLYRWIGFEDIDKIALWERRM